MAAALVQIRLLLRVAADTGFGLFLLVQHGIFLDVQRMAAGTRHILDRMGAGVPAHLVGFLAVAREADAVLLLDGDR
ncbi:hypothetical protein D3C84_982810 [compost metagenome]